MNLRANQLGPLARDMSNNKNIPRRQMRTLEHLIELNMFPPRAAKLNILTQRRTYDLEAKAIIRLYFFPLYKANNFKIQRARRPL